jgi:hypothetical protein
MPGEGRRALRSRHLRRPHTSRRQRRQNSRNMHGKRLAADTEPPAMHGSNVMPASPDAVHIGGSVRPCDVRERPLSVRAGVSPSNPERIGAARGRCRGGKLGSRSASSMYRWSWARCLGCGAVEGCFGRSQAQRPPCKSSSRRIKPSWRWWGTRCRFALGAEEQPSLADMYDAAGPARAPAGGDVVGAAPTRNSMLASQHRPRRSRPTTDWAFGPVGAIR